MSREKFYYMKTMERIHSMRDLLPFADRKKIRINGGDYRNLFFISEDRDCFCPKDGDKSSLSWHPERMRIVVTATFQNPEDKPSTVGRFVSDVKVSVDEKGELYIESPIVCMGYALDYRDFGKGDVNKGIMAIDNLAFIDEAGYFFLKG